MNRLLLSVSTLLLLSACASSEPAHKEDSASAAAASEPAPEPEPEGTSDCDLARVSARAAWLKQFSRVPDLGPEDRRMMADEHASLPDGELLSLEESAKEGGDDVQLEAIAQTRKANAACEG